MYGAATHESAAQDPIITRRTQTGCFMINFIVTSGYVLSIIEHLQLSWFYHVIFTDDVIGFYGPLFQNGHFLMIYDTHLFL